MVNLETLKKEVYQRERKKMFWKFLFGNVLAVLILSVSMSGTKVSERERELISINRELLNKNDSLMKINTVELMSLKEKENKIIRRSLSMDMDTTYIDSSLSVNDMYDYVEKQLSAYESIENVVEGKWDSINSIPIGMPMSLADLYDFNDGFGYRKHPVYKKILFHEGIDLSAFVNSEVFCTGNGIVEKVIENDKGYGNRIVIDHGNGFKTVYAHLNKFNVRVGQRVKKNDVIGYVGSTGTSTGPHLHYEILVKNRPIDPYKYFYIEAKNTLARK
jgi:murein DD-endopeptidase MepM/ murein hydrolase activator NlpD